MKWIDERLRASVEGDMIIRRGDQEILRLSPSTLRSMLALAMAEGMIREHRAVMEIPDVAGRDASS